MFQLYNIIFIMFACMKYFWIILSIFLLASCGSDTTKSEDASQATEIPVIVQENNTVVVVDSVNDHSVVYDAAGTYEWNLPCADCPGIETYLTLEDTMDYVLEQAYVDKDEEPSVTTWTYEIGTGTVMLSWDNTPTYKIGENTLTQLDSLGNVVEGDLAERYVLERQ